MTDADLRRVRELIAEVRDHLNDKVDVDTHVGDGSVSHRISPYQSVGSDIRALDEALYLLREKPQRPLDFSQANLDGTPARSPLVQVDPEDAGTSFPVFASRSD